jgi:hypothetical protein
MSIAYLVTGFGAQAQASSLGMIGSGLVGPVLGPVPIGIISDTAAPAGIPGRLGFALPMVPLSSALADLAFLVANQRVADFLRK